jgi:hypothetical protein
MCNFTTENSTKTPPAREADAEKKIYNVTNPR